ncbi:hypothetical protein HBH92_110310 [Parastagonospora nodorum]|nr:hypothetical protein HBH46_053580 [Parastagonospora nodorum]KAH4412319.1 hypothetical protein HBH92_110310 [Parastagonospora nodorum]KAH4438956.1 hypothetical protein HBH93_092490 [Parastagonospora nodorum]KAH4445168.1 hypothetical protein HBH91_150140 [Parastagonospora nodorum]KAH4492931.1 hypothetical protein HBH89_168270 [Parastagonospora nodorum]
MQKPTPLFSMDSCIWGYKPQTAEHYCEWINQRNQRESRLLRLPAEIRNMIFDLACQDTAINIPYIALVQPREPHKRAHQGSSALLHTSRQVRHEAHPIFYFHAVFKFGGIGTANLNNKLGQHVCEHIRAIELPQSVATIMTLSGTNVDLCKTEYGADLPSLDHVYVKVVEGLWSSSGPAYNIYGNIEGAVRKIYDRPRLIALVTTVPYTPPSPLQ